MAATRKSAQQRLDRDFRDGSISLQDYVDRINAEHAAYQDQWRNDHIRMHALEKRALDVADKVVTKELEHLNHLRQEVVTDRGLFVKRDMFDLASRGYVKRFEEIDKKLAYYAGGLAAYSLVLTIFLALHDHIFKLFGE